MLLGYEITTVILVSLISMLALLIASRKELRQVLSKHMNTYSLLCLFAILLFFIVFSITKVSAVEQLYFDENIYQGVAINILKHGNALWCQYGTGYLGSCSVNALYHDPVGWSVFIAIAFGIFGVGFGTAYGFQLFAGALSIVAVFLLSSVFFEKKHPAVISTLVFSMMPQLYIWSRTQADIDLPFMMLATWSFFFFVVFTKKRSASTLALFALSLVLTVYMRIEAVLLVGVFALLAVTFDDTGIRKAIGKNMRLIGHALGNSTMAIVLLIVFFVLILPEVYYIAIQIENPSYGQSSNQQVLSLTNFENNIGTNIAFVFGLLNGINFYPTVFHGTVMALAILGTLLFALDRRNWNRSGKLLMLWLWFIAYFVFYSFFYAGSATFGVDSRFMLQLLPPLALLASMAIFELGDIASRIARNRARKVKDERGAVFYLGIAVVFSVLVLYPFLVLVPIITLKPQDMPQQSVILKAVNFFYSNYEAVPKNCLVFSFTPDIWYEVNRSSAQIGYLNGANSTLKSGFSNYGCVVMDYGYWCVVPPYQDSLCKLLTGEYRMQTLASGSAGNGYNTTLYQILNYT